MARVPKCEGFFSKNCRGYELEKVSYVVPGAWLGDSAYDPRVTPADVGHICLCTGKSLGSHMGAGKMLKRLQHLSWACAEVHLELVGIDDEPLSIHIHAVVME